MTFDSSQIMALAGFFLLELCLFRVAYSAVSALLAREPGILDGLFWTLVLGVKLLLASMLMLAFAAAGWLGTPFPAAVFLLVFILAEIARRRFAPHPRARPQARGSLIHAGLAALAAAAALPFLLARLGPTSETDSVTHLGLLAKWIQHAGSIYNFPYSYSSFYEASFLPALVFARYDAMISLLSLQAVVLFAAALYQISRLALSSRLATFAATLHGVLFSHLWMGVSGVGTAKNDMIYNAGLLLFTLAFLRFFRGDAGPAAVLCAVLGAAFATVKFSGPLALIVVALAAAALFAAARRFREFVAGLKAALLPVCAILLVTNGHFYLRNLLLHGNPFFPQKLKVLGFALPGTVDFSGTSILSQWKKPEVWKAFLATFQEGYLFPAAVLAPFLLAASAWLFRPFRNRPQLLMLSLASAGLWFLFMSSLWSAGMYPGQTDIIEGHFSLRYASAACALSLVSILLAAEALGPRLAAGLAAVVLADSAFRWYHLAQAAWILRLAGVDSGVVAVAATVVLATALAAWRRMRLAAAAAIYMVLFLYVPARGERFRPLIWVGGEGEIFQQLAYSPPSTVWSVIGEDTWPLIYPLTGARFQNRILEIDAQQAIRQLQRCSGLPDYVHIHGYRGFPSKVRTAMEPALAACRFSVVSLSSYGVLYQRPPDR